MKKTPSTWYKLPATVLVAFLAVNAHAQISKVVNAASFVQNTSLTPGSIVSIFGTNLTNTTAYATTSVPANLPTTLGGLSMKVAGLDCPLFYVSPTQVNAQIAPKATQGQVPLVITSPTGTFTTTVSIQPAGVPGLFTYTATGTRDGAILNAVTFERGPFSVTTGGSPTYLALYATGLNLLAPLKVTIGGIEVPVQYCGDAPGFLGLQQINVQLLPSLAGVGRVEVAVTSGGNVTNIVEVVILPNPGQTSYAPKGENEARDRELAAIAAVPGKSLALLTDENDDVVRVLDLKQQTVVKTIALPDGAEPVAVAVNSDGTLAVVAERDLARVAVIDLTVSPLAVAFEISLAQGPSSVAIAGRTALVVSQDQDTVAVINLDTKVVKQVAVGRGPRYVAVNGTRAYVTNQGDGTISIIDVPSATVVGSYNLGSTVRPFAIQIVPSYSVAVVTVPSAGKVLLLDLSSGNILSSLDIRVEKSGGLSDIAVNGAGVFLANQAGGSVTPANVVPGPPIALSTGNAIKVDIGARALAVDTYDNLLLVTNEGSGTVVLVNLTNNQIAGRINGVRCECEDEDEDHDQRDDREHAANAPVITSLSPNTGTPGGASFVLAISGANLAGASDVVFIDPSAMPGKGKGRHEDHGDNHGPWNVRDTAFTCTMLSSSANTVTINVTIAAKAALGNRLVRVLSPNGESSGVLSPANTFKVTQ